MQFSFKENSPIGEDRGAVARMADKKVILSYQPKNTPPDHSSKGVKTFNLLFIIGDDKAI
ncbi:hypothetical protein F7731_20015 [Cytobacillus depressus]|uniref:Uncharacterized protein n=1 Tax=Cytobacillus depressus TaxID=1602942 RepID=A0A6L3V203_9BACI|nr:hypothetical protein F7731_20015 [Cytobacillus depressus]